MDGFILIFRIFLCISLLTHRKHFDCISAYVYVMFDEWLYHDAIDLPELWYLCVSVIPFLIFVSTMHDLVVTQLFGYRGSLSLVKILSPFSRLIYLLSS